MSSPASVNWDVAKVTKDLIEDEWDYANTDKPQYIELRTEDSEGNTRKKVRRHNEYILFAEQGERGMEYSDIFWETRNLNTSCYAEISTSKSRERREELIAEVERIAVNARTPNEDIGTPGGWDRLNLEVMVTDDENFGWWVAEVTFSYTKVKDNV